MSTVFVGVDIGGTRTKLGVVDEAGELLAVEHIETLPERGPEDVVRRVVTAGRKLVSDCGRRWDGVEAVGVACAGLIHAPTRVLKTSPNLPGWEDVPLARILASAIDRDVFLDNDVNALAYGESRIGVARGRSYGVFLALGTGVGGGLLLDGEIYRGYCGFGGELGHVVIDPDGPVCECGNRGCLESLVRSRTIVETAVAYYRKAGKLEELERMAGGRVSAITTVTLATAASVEDELALRVFRETGRWVGIAVGGFINAFNPEIVVIGGGVAQVGEALLRPIRNWAGRYAFSASYSAASIVVASLGENAGMMGAALEARDRCSIPCR